MIYIVQIRQGDQTITVMRTKNYDSATRLHDNLIKDFDGFNVTISISEKRATDESGVFGYD